MLWQLPPLSGERKSIPSRPQFVLHRCQLRSRHFQTPGLQAPACFLTWALWLLHRYKCDNCSLFFVKFLFASDIFLTIFYCFLSLKANFNQLPSISVLSSNTIRSLASKSAWFLTNLYRLENRKIQTTAKNTCHNSPTYSEYQTQ